MTTPVELTTQQLEAALEAQAKLAARHPRWWEHYAWTHAEIDRLLTEWESAKAREQSRKRVLDRFLKLPTNPA